MPSTQSKQLATLKGHSKPVFAVCIHKNIVCSASGDHTIRMWNLETRDFIGKLEGHTNTVTALCTYQNFLCSGSSDKSIMLWDLKAQQCLATLNGHQDYVKALSVYENTLISGSGDKSIVLWNIDLRERYATLIGHSHSIRALCTNKKFLFSGSYDKTIRMWDLSHQQLSATLIGHESTVSALCIFQDLLCSGSDDNTIRLWNISSQLCTVTLAGHQDTINGFCIYEEVLCSCSSDNSIKLWDLSSKACIDTLTGHVNGVNGLCNECNESSILCSGSQDQTINLWDIAETVKKYRADVSLQLGIGLHFVLENFQQEVAEKTRLSKDDVSEMNFIELSEVVAYGPLAYGKGKVCPRDCRIDCSIVDAVRDDGYSAKATFFLSWVWKYPLVTVLSALCFFLKSRPDVVAEDTFLWWCFFVNNQFRILEEKTHQSFETLQHTFKTELQKTGKMLCLFDRIAQSLYAQRLWCLFEVLVATEAKTISIDVIIPETATAELQQILALKEKDEAKEFISVRSELAEATSPEDQANIRKLIEDKIGYPSVNSIVTGALTESLGLLVKQWLQDELNAEDQANKKDGKAVSAQKSETTQELTLLRSENTALKQRIKELEVLSAKA